MEQDQIPEKIYNIIIILSFVQLSVFYFTIIEI